MFQYKTMTQYRHNSFFKSHVFQFGRKKCCAYRPIYPHVLWSIAFLVSYRKLWQLNLDISLLNWLITVWIIWFLDKVKDLNFGILICYDNYHSIKRHNDENRKLSHRNHLRLFYLYKGTFCDSPGDSKDRYSRYWWALLPYRNVC